MPRACGIGNPARHAMAFLTDHPRSAARRVAAKTSARAAATKARRSPQETAKPTRSTHWFSADSPQETVPATPINQATRDKFLSIFDNPAAGRHFRAANQQPLTSWPTISLSLVAALRAMSPPSAPRNLENPSLASKPTAPVAPASTGDASRPRHFSKMPSSTTRSATRPPSSDSRSMGSPTTGRPWSVAHAKFPTNSPAASSFSSRKTKSIMSAASARSRAPAKSA